MGARLQLRTRWMDVPIQCFVTSREAPKQGRAPPRFVGSEVEEEHVPVLVPLSKSRNIGLAHPSTVFEAEAGHPLESDADAVHVEVRAKSVILEATLSVDPEVSLLFGVEKQALQPPVEESPNFEETL